MIQKYFVALAVALTISFSIATAQAAFAPLSLVKETPKEERSELDKTISRKAFTYSVSEDTLRKVIKCESSNNPNAMGDGGHSRGLVQIYDTYHPNITNDMAFDPEFSVDFLAKNISQGKGYLWTCYRNLI